MLAISLKDEPHTPQRMGSDSDISVGAGPTSQPDASTTVITGFESPASKPRLVGLRQPFFATSPPLESSHDQLEAMERVAAQASKSGAKVRVLVAEDNKVNQEVVLRMLKLEDIYGMLRPVLSSQFDTNLNFSRRDYCQGWPRSI